MMNWATLLLLSLIFYALNLISYHNALPAVLRFGDQTKGLVIFEFIFLNVLRLAA